MAKLMEHVTELADEIGPRPVSTEEEHRASLYIAEHLTEAGLQVDVDEFATPTGVRWPYAVIFLVMIASVVVSGLGKFIPFLSTTFYAVGLLLLIISLFFYFTERMGKPILSKLFVKGVSQNVVAKYVPSSVAREKRRRKVIIVAHVDTTRAQLEAMPSVINVLPKVLKNIKYVMIGLAALFIIRMLPLPWPDTVDFVLWIISLVACVLLLVCVVCIVAHRFMPYVSGGNDNASSVAVMLDVARRILDPAERERFAKEIAEGQAPAEEGEALEEGDVLPVETLAEPAATGSFSAVIHTAEEAEAAGVVPEGAFIEYEDEEPEEPVFDEPADEPEFVAEEPEPVEEPEVDLEPAQEPAAAAAEESQEVALGGNWPTAEEIAAEPEPEPVIEPEPVAVPVAQPEPAPAATGLPSWYTAAKRKAAKEPAAEQAEEAGAYRSRFADVPIKGVVATAQPEPEPEPEPVIEPEPVAEIAPEPVVEAAPAADPMVSMPTEAFQPVFAQSEPEEVALGGNWPTVEEIAAEPESVVEPEPVVEAAPEPEPAVFVPRFDIAEEAFDEIDPDFEEEVVEPAQAEPKGLQALRNMIPSIGDSLGKDSSDQPAERKASKPQRAKKAPTTRTLDDSFVATKAVDDRSEVADALTQSRQVAAVNANYGDTPQGGPAFDPFAPKGTPEADASLISPAASTSFPAINSAVTGTIPVINADGSAAPGSTSSFPSLTGSFPSLTGSFPSLTGSIPVIGQEELQDDFYAADESDFGEFSPAITSEINIPDSKMRDAMDNVGGFFGKLGRKRKKSKGVSDDPWNESAGGSDDDFGWKGGGYYDSDSAKQANEAARQRAAQIRESVVSMTENDMLDKEVWFVALGASGAGNMGMKNFLSLHGSELRGSLIINLEGVGAGDICFVDYEGLTKVRRSDRRLQSLVRRTSKDMEGKEMSAERLDWRDTDATPALMAGQRAMTIMGFDGVASEGWRWSTDTSDIVDEEKLEYVTKLLMRMIENS